jgi:hypothetical protein
MQLFRAGGYRAVRHPRHVLEKPMRGRQPSPKNDPLFGNRRFWPEVLKWQMDYHGVSAEYLPTAAQLWEGHIEDSVLPCSHDKEDIVL